MGVVSYDEAVLWTVHPHEVKRPAPVAPLSPEVLPAGR